MDDVTKGLAPNSSAWWLARLNVKLDQRAAEILLYQQYYLGIQRQAFATAKFRETFGNLFKALSVNFCLLVVDAERERLNVEGFRLGGDSDKNADMDAWRMWQRNRLDYRSAVAHAEALSKGITYITVWNNPTDPTVPTIRVQDALQVYVEEDDGDLDARLAAIKRWIDPASGLEFATLYFPDRIEKYQSKTKPTLGSPGVRPADYWQHRTVAGEEWPLPNPLNVVPVLPLRNNPMLGGDGRSEIAAMVPIQDSINKLVADLIIASEFVAFPQRWATGIEVPVDENGREIEPFKAAVNRLWIADVKEGLDQTIQPQFGQFKEASLAPYVSALEMLVQFGASITKTPAHYLLGQSGNFPSGESLKATETGLVAKTRGAMAYFGNVWEDVIRLGFQVINDPKADSPDMETIWRDPESRVLSEVADAAVKQKLVNVPDEILWEKLGYSQTEIARMRVLAAQSALLNPPLPGVGPGALLKPAAALLGGAPTTNVNEGGNNAMSVMQGGPVVPGSKPA